MTTAWAERLQQAWLRRGALACSLLPLAWFYGWLLRLRAVLYRIGALKVRRLDVPVLVVGNLVAGGAGKTPTVLAVRTDTHKLITYPGHDEWTEAFDLVNDPFEIKNLVGDKSLVKKLRSTFDAEAKSVKFQMPKIPTKPNNPPANVKKKSGAAIRDSSRE